MLVLAIQMDDDSLNILELSLFSALNKSKLLLYLVKTIINPPHLYTIYTIDLKCTTQVKMRKIIGRSPLITVTYGYKSY